MRRRVHQLSLARLLLTEKTFLDVMKTSICSDDIVVFGKFFDRKLDCQRNFKVPNHGRGLNDEKIPFIISKKLKILQRIKPKNLISNIPSLSVSKFILQTKHDISMRSHCI